ncbi:MAG: AbfB domain-containing protein [Rubrivivax sp.]
MNACLRTLAAAAALALLSSCGGEGGDATSSASTASAAARLRPLAATTTLAVPIPQDADSLLQGLTIPADAPTRGMWGATQPWPMNGLHAVLMPTGKVLTYGTPKDVPGTQDGRTYDLWTPALGFGAASHVTSADNARYNSFCSAATWLPDGRLIVTGGNSATNSVLVNGSSGATSNDAAALADQRWYATMLTLPDGRALIVGGMDPYSEGMVDAPDTAIANGTVSMTPELYTPGSGWLSLPGARSRDAFGPDYLRASYPRAWVAPDGKVFGISAETLWSLDVAANGGSGGVTVHGRFKTPASTNAPVNVGATSSAVMFAPGRILQAGGNGYFNGDGYPASNKATVVDINGATPVLTETAAMTHARRYINLVVLPDGRVLATGGTRVGNNGGADAVYPAEIWNPATGTWTLAASAAQIRVYHSATLLLPNGTVLSTGGGAPGPVNNQNAEVYYPPYLFRSVGGVAQLAPRPVMTGINALGFAHGGAMQVEMADSAAVSRLVLVANGAVTHSFNSGQRFIELPFTQTGDRLAATLPASAATAPPGYYQVFALDAGGVPSRAVIVSLGLSTSAPPPAPVLQRGQTYLFESAGTPGQAIATDAADLGVLAAGSAANAPLTSRFVVRDGLADASCVSLESVAQPGRWLRHYGYRLQLGTSDGSDLFKGDATFCPEAGLAGSGLSLRSKNYPARVLRHVNAQIWIDPETTDATLRQSASFVPRLLDATLPVIGSLPAAPLPAGATAAWAPGLEAAGLTFSWDFGDGSAATAFGASSSASHVYAGAGLYTVTLTARAASGATTTRTFVQAVYAPPTVNAPRASGALLLEPRTGAAARLWVLNPDNDSVSVFDTATNARVAEIAVGSAPRTLARAADGSIWVANRDAASLSVISAATLAVTRTVALPRASQPHGLVIAADGRAYVALEALGQVLKLDGSSGATLATLAVGARPRHLAVTGDSARLLVSRFITPPLTGEGSASVTTSSGGGEVVAVNTGAFTVAATVLLKHSDKADTEISGRGVPNYLGAAAIAPDGSFAWVPSKQDNVKRGGLRDGLALNFQNTVRAISSRIELGTLAETLAMRVDHDNASVASAAAFDPTGSYLFVALETSRQVAVVDPRRGAELFRIEVGLAPQGVVVAADGSRLYVHNFMSRTVSVVDLGPLMRNGELRSTTVATPATVAAEKLSATVLKGKQLFYDARDPRLARDAYLSCATCHHDGGHDGRTWDLTSQGEGLRNTISLRGRAGGQGRLHWSNNFDEVQDFEGQIRALAGGTGLMTDAQFNTGTRSQPLGDAKAGVSADLDALAAYVASLNAFDPSPYRPSASTLSAAASAGRTLFTQMNCGFCHSASAWTRSAVDNPANVGTIKAASGKRLGGTLAGIDVPTLRDLWATAPYLHDGSAATIEAAIKAHANQPATDAQLTSLAAYLRELGGEEGAAPTPSTSGAGLLGSYYAGTALAGTPLAQRIEAVNFSWGNAAPAIGVPADGFSVRWSGRITIPTTGSYRFRTVSDDGVRLWVNGTQRIGNWTDHGSTTDTSSSFSLSAGRVSITLEYYERSGGAVMQLQWLRPGASTYEAVPASALSVN